MRAEHASMCGGMQPSAAWAGAGTRRGLRPAPCPTPGRVDVDIALLEFECTHRKNLIRVYVFKSKLHANARCPARRRYYSDPKLLSFTLHPPGTPSGFNTWADGGAMLTWHLQALRKQMAQFYWAAVLATLTGRCGTC